MALNPYSCLLHAENFGGMGAEPPFAAILPRIHHVVSHYVCHEKQLFCRLPESFINLTIADFNACKINAARACSDLQISRSALYKLRSAYLKNQRHLSTKTSGGNHRSDWPSAAITFLHEFIPLQTPPNFQLIADELLRLFAFKRSRSSIESYIKKNLPHLIQHEPKKPRNYRRFRRAYIGELWQHDSSIHQWWQGSEKQTLLLTLDDHSGYIVAATFVTRDTTWNHFEHFRKAFAHYGLPQAIYTDGLSLFGNSSAHDNSDPRSEFQRALKPLGVAHLVAPTPQAKGKIERRFRTYQNRLLALLAYAKVSTYPEANEVLQAEVDRLNRTLSRSIGKIPSEEWENQSLSNQNVHRQASSSLLDLHLSLRLTRKVNNDKTIDFDGKTYQISPTQRKRITIIHHLERKIWITETPPEDTWPNILGEFTL